MPALGNLVYQLPGKIDALAQGLRLAGRIDKASREMLCAHAGIKYPTLRAALRSSRFTHELTERLSKGCALELTVPQWIDPKITDTIRLRSGSDYPGRDTVEQFRDYVFRCFDLQGFGQLVLRQATTYELDRDMAVISLTDLGQSTASFSPMQLFLQLDFTPSHHEAGFFYGFKKVRIRLQADARLRVSVKDRLAFPEDVLLKDAKLKLRGTDHHHVWELSVDRGVLDGSYATTDNPLCKVLGIEPDVEMEAEMSVQLHDGYLADKKGDVLDRTFANVIIQVLMSKKVAEGNRDSDWLVLGRQTVRIVLVDNG